MTAKEAFWLTRENSNFITDEQGMKISCDNYDGAGWIVYRVGDEVFTRSYCWCDGFSNHKVPAERAKYLIETGDYAYSF